MEATGLVLILLIIVGAGTGISALISSFYLQKRVLDLYKVVFELNEIIFGLREEVKKCQKKDLEPLS